MSTEQKPAYYATTNEGVVEFVEACDDLIQSPHVRKAVFDVYNKVTRAVYPTPPKTEEQFKEPKSNKA